MPTSTKPSTTQPPTLPPTLTAALAQRAAETPEEPWLFHRQYDDWRWRSWSQVAHQVVEGAEALRRSGVLEAGDGGIAFAATMDPDAFVLDLAIRLAGGQAVPVVELGASISEMAWARVGIGQKTNGPSSEDPARVIVLPSAPSRLSRWTPDLVALRARTAGTTEHASDVWLEARRWREVLPVVVGKKRPIVLASASVDHAIGRTLMAWTLMEAAAWVLEKDPERFVTAALRNRPTLVLAPASDAGLLALAFQERRYRRWHRLQAVVLTDDAPGEIAREDEWGQMGIPVRRLVV